MATTIQIQRVEVRFPVNTAGTLVDAAGTTTAYVTYSKNVDGVITREVSMMTSTPANLDPPHSFLNDVFEDQMSIAVPP